MNNLIKFTVTGQLFVLQQYFLIPLGTWVSPLVFSGFQNLWLDENFWKFITNFFYVFKTLSWYIKFLDFIHGAIMLIYAGGRIGKKDSDQYVLIWHIRKFAHIKREKFWVVGLDMKSVVSWPGVQILTLIPSCRNLTNNYLSQSLSFFCIKWE